MRDSAVPDGVIAAVLKLERVSEPPGVNERIRQALDRLEKPLGRNGRREGRTRAALSYAIRRTAAAAASAGQRGVSVEDDPRFLRARVKFYEAMGQIWRAEETRGAFTRWLPHYMRGDPFAELEHEIARDRAQIAKLESARRDARRAAANAQLVDRRTRRPMTTQEYRNLSALDRAEIERAFGLDEPPELRKFGAGYDDGVAA